MTRRQRVARSRVFGILDALLAAFAYGAAIIRPADGLRRMADHPG